MTRPADHDCQRESCGGLGDYNGPCGGCCGCFGWCVWDGPDDDDGPRTMKEEYLLYQEMVGNGTPNQCAGAVHSPAGSAPERCALPEWHEGKCEP